MPSSDLRQSHIAQRHGRTQRSQPKKSLCAEDAPILPFSNIGSAMSSAAIRSATSVSSPSSSSVHIAVSLPSPFAVPRRSSRRRRPACRSWVRPRDSQTQTTPNSSTASSGWSRHRQRRRAGRGALRPSVTVDRRTAVKCHGGPPSAALCHSVRLQGVCRAAFRGPSAAFEKPRNPCTQA